MKILNFLKSKPKSANKLVKFAGGSSLDAEDEYDYGLLFEKSEGVIKVAASSNQTELMLDLASCLKPPYYVLYVLVTSRTGKQLGRYQSPLFENKESLSNFLKEHETYFETDGRHHIWIGTQDSGLLVYDQHNVIFSYGPLQEIELKLIDKGFKEKEFQFPIPHGHSYHPENDKFEELILKSLNWEVFPLQEHDTYD